jgi:N-acetyl sugar amidotransferase
MQRPYSICKRCVMDTSDPDITFDSMGYCNHCNNYFINLPKYVLHGKPGEEKLQAIVDQIKRDGRNKPYDCIIGLSGGVDSSYVAWKVKEAGLRPLAVHFDSGWNSELAVMNIENIVKTLNFDLFTFVCDWTEMRDLQLSYFRAGVINADIPMDHAFTIVLYRMARKYGIKHFISGQNYETEAILPHSWVYNSRDARNLKAIQQRFGSVKLRKYPVGSLMESIYNLYVYKLNRLYILDYEKYNKAEVLEILQEKLGWRNYGGKHHESIFTRFYQGYYLLKRFGIDKRRAHLSSLICSSQITREEALKELNHNPYENAELLRQDLEYIPKKLGISVKEFEKIMLEPTHPHTYYPNDTLIREKLVNFGKKLNLKRPT